MGRAEGPHLPKRLPGARLAACHVPYIDTDTYSYRNVSAYHAEWNMLVFGGRRKYIHFFQVYFNIQRCSRFVSLEKQKDTMCVQRAISLELPFGVDFMKFWRRKKNCFEYTSTVWLESMNLYVHLCIFTYIVGDNQKKIQSGCLGWLRSGALWGELHHLLMISAPVVGVPPDFWLALSQQRTVPPSEYCQEALCWGLVWNYGLFPVLALSLLG